MNKFLVTGRAGSGKSAVNKGLGERQYNSIDSDRFPGLTRWEDVNTGQRVTVNTNDFVDYTKVVWNWQRNVMNGLLTARKTLFVCGSASNQLEFHPLFDKVFVLAVDPEVQRQRLQERPENYGKHPAQQDEIIAEQAEFVEQAIALGGIAIDNNRPINKVIDDIVRLANV